MNDLLKLAVSKAIKAKDVKTSRRGIEVGTYEVDENVHVFGSLTVGEDYETTPTVAIPYKKAFAALCRVSGCTGPAGIAKIRRAMEIALADDTDDTAKDVLAGIEDVNRIEREVIEPMLANLPKLECRGKVTTKLTAEISRFIPQL